MRPRKRSSCGETVASASVSRNATVYLHGSSFLRQHFDSAKVEIAGRTPALDPGRNLGTELLVEGKSGDCQFLGLVRLGERLHRLAHPCQIVPELALQVAFDAAW